LPNKTPIQTSVGLPILQPGNPKSASKQLKSGRGRLRAAVLILVHLLILAHVTHYWVSGRSLSPVEPSESMYTLELGQVNAGAIFFGLAIVSTLIFGRFFCGWGCHLVALQDLSGYCLRRIGIRPKPLRSRLLMLVPFALAFYMFFWPTVNRLWKGEPHPGFTNHLMTDNFWETFPGPVVSILTFVVCGGVIVYLLGNKGFCTYACPYGAFFSVADRLAVARIHVTDACHQCGQCTAHCTSNVQVHAEVRDFGMVVDPGCMKCMDCVSVCPNDALYFGLKRRPSQEGSGSLQLDSDKPPKNKNKNKNKKSFDYSMPEELLGLVVAGGTVYGLRGLYDIPPLLLSVAVGVITAFLAIQLIRIFRRPDHRIQNIQIKRRRQLTKIGTWGVVALCLWFVFVIHSIFVQYHRYRGRDHLGRIVVTWTELLTRSAQPRFTAAERADIEKALYSYGAADWGGLVGVKEVKLGLGIGSLMQDDFEKAEIYLRQAYQLDPAGVRELWSEFLAIQGRWEEVADTH